MHTGNGDSLMTYLSPHFKYSEFRIPENCDQDTIESAIYLCNEVLEPIRDHFDKVLVITSGRRLAKDNQRVGGVTLSQHLFLNGDAAVDFFVIGVPLQKVFDWIRTNSNLDKIDQVILEKDKDTGRDACIHISTNRSRKARNVAYIGQTHGTGKYTKVTFVITKDT